MNLPSEPPPDPAPRRRGARPWGQPETEFPAVVQVGTLRFDTTGPSAVAVTGVRAYRNGFEFFVTRLLRPDSPGFAGGPPGALHRRNPLGVWQDFMIGVEFSDGRSMLASGELPPTGPLSLPGDGDGDGDGEPAGPVLHFNGGSGGGHRTEVRWLTWPLPPPGRLDFICRLGADETQVSMDAQLILDASQRIAKAWPDA